MSIMSLIFVLLPIVALSADWHCDNGVKNVTYDTNDEQAEILLTSPIYGQQTEIKGCLCNGYKYFSSHTQYSLDIHESFSVCNDERMWIAAPKNENDECLNVGDLNPMMNVRPIYLTPCSDGDRYQCVTCGERMNMVCTALLYSESNGKGQRIGPFGIGLYSISYLEQLDWNRTDIRSLQLTAATGSGAKCTMFLYETNRWGNGWYYNTVGSRLDNIPDGRDWSMFEVKYEWDQDIDPVYYNSNAPFQVTYGLIALLISLLLISLLISLLLMSYNNYVKSHRYSKVDMVTRSDDETQNL